MHIANYWPGRSYPANYWPDWPPQVIDPDGLAVGVAFGELVVFQPGEVQAILPDGLAVDLALGELTVTRRPAAVIPLYEIDLDERAWLVPADNRIYEVDI